MDDWRLIPLFPEDAAWMKNLRPGDPVTRWLAATIPIDMTVTAIHDGLIWCGPWSFDPRNRAEVDPELGFGPNCSGSYIRPPGH